jgi:regulator of protease activity HflC (stomatin/prohibitin superfamily)
LIAGGQIVFYDGHFYHDILLQHSRDFAKTVIAWHASSTAILRKSISVRQSIPAFAGKVTSARVSFSSQLRINARSTEVLFSADVEKAQLAALFLRHREPHDVCHGNAAHFLTLVSTFIRRTFMENPIKSVAQAIRSIGTVAGKAGIASLKSGGRIASAGATVLISRRSVLLLLGSVAALTYLVYRHPPLQHIDSNNIGIRVNQLTGNTEQMHAGFAIVIPGLHEIKTYSLQDQVYHPTESSKADGGAPFQSVEGLSLGADLTVSYALDSSHLSYIANKLPQDVGAQVVEPMVRGVIYKTFARYTVREIFSAKRQEIQQSIEAELKPKLAANGIALRSVTLGQIDLPAEYKRGMERLLAEELASEKMRYTLELKDKEVKQTELEAEAQKVKREKDAEAAGNEQIIAAKAQEEAMKHVLPFKQKQIEQRQYEAEAEKVARIKTSEGSAQARIIEAAAEADSRRKLAEAEAYRQEIVGKVASAQLERDGALISKHPLLIQKTMADKLSDKISVIIAPPSVDGGFVGSNLIGNIQAKHAASDSDKAGADAANGEEQK